MIVIFYMRWRQARLIAQSDGNVKCCFVYFFYLFFLVLFVVFNFLLCDCDCERIWLINNLCLLARVAGNTFQHQWLKLSLNWKSQRQIVYKLGLIAHLLQLFINVLTTTKQNMKQSRRKKIINTFNT